MLLYPRSKFNEKLQTGKWTDCADTPLFFKVSGYPMTDEGREIGFPLREMSQVLFDDANTLISGVLEARETCILMYDGI